MPGTDAGAPTGAPARWAPFTGQELAAVAYGLASANLRSAVVSDLAAEIERELDRQSHVEPPPPGTGGRPFAARVIEANVAPDARERLAALLGPVGPTVEAGPTGPPTMTEAGPEGTGPRPFGPGEHTPAPGRDELEPAPSWLAPLDGLLAGVALERGGEFWQGPAWFALAMDEAADGLAAAAFAESLSWEQAANLLGHALVRLFKDGAPSLELAAMRVLERARWTNANSTGLLPDMPKPEGMGLGLELLPYPVVISAEGPPGLGVRVSIPGRGHRVMRNVARVIVIGANPDPDDLTACDG